MDKKTTTNHNKLMQKIYRGLTDEGLTPLTPQQELVIKWALEDEGDFSGASEDEKWGGR